MSDDALLALEPADPLLSARSLGRALSRGALLGALHTVVVALLVVLPHAAYLPGRRILLYAFLMGLLSAPLWLLEGPGRRAARGRAAAQAALAAFAGLLAFAAVGLAWTQANYTFAVLESGSLSQGLALLERGAGTLSRRTHVATTLILTPTVALAVGALLRLRDEPARAEAATAVMLALAFAGITHFTCDHGHDYWATAYAAAGVPLPTLACRAADAVWGRAGGNRVNPDPRDPT